MYSTLQGVRKQPPRVIPYHKHQEGKKRLAEVLKQQGQRGSGTFDQMAVLKYLNSPESAVPDDVAEKASLDSRGSTEASISISSGEVATGTLIELAGPTLVLLLYTLFYCTTLVNVSQCAVYCMYRSSSN